MTLQDIMKKDTISRSHLIDVLRHDRKVYTIMSNMATQTRAEVLEEIYGHVIEIIQNESPVYENGTSDEAVFIDKISLMNNIESFVINNTDSSPVDVIKIVDKHPVASVDLTQIAMNVVNYLIEERGVECISAKEVLQAMISPSSQGESDNVNKNTD